MKTPVCDTGKVALSDATRDRVHARCPGWWKDPAGNVHPCDCECHGDGAPPPTDESALVTLTPPPTGESTGRGTSASRKAEKRPPGARRCHCCGEPCNGRSLPGHDAKLKGILTRAAHAGDADAWAEVLVRGWDHVVSKGKVPPQVRAEGRRRVGGMTAADEEAFLLRRNSDRASL